MKNFEWVKGKSKIYTIEFIDGNNDLCIGDAFGINEKEVKEMVRQEFVVKKMISCCIKN